MVSRRCRCLDNGSERTLLCYHAGFQARANRGPPAGHISPQDGTLEGDVSIEYTGHEAAARKELTEKQSDSQREEVLKNILKRYASAAEFSNIKIENVNDPEKPLIYRSYLRVPGYAQRTGKRLFFTPSTSFRKLFMIFCLPCGARFRVQRRTSVRRGPVERRGARNCGLKPTAAR